MKRKNIIYALFSLMVIGTLGSCKDLLDRAPLSQVTPEVFFFNEADLAAYTINNYPSVFGGTPSAFANSVYSGDVNTDNQAASSTPSNLFRPNEVKVGAGTDNWSFSQIRYCNYFLNIVLPRWKVGAISGNKINVDHYIGEMYFMRAMEYFKNVRNVGDYPIIKTVLPDDFDILIAANNRSPRNEVMRFVISDLDSAIMLLGNAPIGAKTRITKNAALQIKSRAALYEGSFLKNFKGTAYVPLGQGWPGATKEYSKNYQYPTGSVEAEADWFLDQAIDAADKLASAVKLVNNTKNAAEISGIIAGENMSNPYFKMFSDVAGLNGYSEILLWKEYSETEKTLHSNAIYIQAGGWSCGLTRGLVDSYVMENGLPIYADNSQYKGDQDFTSWRDGRDWRLQLFTKAKDDHSVFPTHVANGKKYPGPRLLTATSESVDNTGYSSRKYMDYKVWGINGSPCYNGHPVMRAAEAYLDYIEAYYMRFGTLGGNCDKYWREIRTRAGINPDYNVTINATEVAKEAANDWGAYTAGVLVDPTLYNIRRERRCEFISEGRRWDDLVRWRAMDQLVTKRYHIEGFRLWAGENSSLYNNPQGKTLLKWNGDPAGNTGGYNVSAPEISQYLRPFQVIKANNYFYDGLSWHSAHYLRPIGANNFLLTAPDGATIETSPIYQNPGWDTTPSSSPTVVPGF